MRIGNILCTAVSAFVLTLMHGPAEAATCGSYVVKRGDTLSEVSQALYGTATKWRSLYRANRRRIGRRPRFMRIGLRLRVPCLKGYVRTASRAKPSDELPDALPADTGGKQAGVSGDANAVGSTEIALLTADDYRPFTDRALPAGGMITDIVDTALKARKEETRGPAHRISWVNDWSAHLSPLLVRNAFDMGFPWFRPECERYAELDTSARFRCDQFHFSDPVFEILVRFFKHRDSAFDFSSDEAVVGKRICRPAGYFTFDLDKDGRNWVKNDRITLLRPQRVEDCFRLLQRREVDAIAINEFTGHEAIAKLGLKDTVRVIRQPVSVLSLHVIVPKTHKRAQAYLDHINSSLGRLRETGAYDRIVDRHLATFWETREPG